MFGWLTDTFRLNWGALYWNTRKSWHIARGRRGRCPCQVASDSGRAMQTGCEGVLHYRSPGRFRTVCPLLARRDDGNWACSVDAADVRPFWGRALVLLGGGALVAGLLAMLTAFALLRGIGYDISFRQVAWPRAWGEFRQVQARYYLKRAGEAQAAGDFKGSMLRLSNAYELSGDFSTGLTLAKLSQIGQPLQSDRIYSRLFRDHPDQRSLIAEAWYQALLARGDFGALQRLAGERLLHSGDTPPTAWRYAFLFATRQLAEPGAIARLLEEPGLPRSVAPLLELERRLYSLSAADRVLALTAEVGRSADPFVNHHLLRRLMEEDRAEFVLSIASSGGVALDDRASARLQLDALAALGRDARRAALARELLARPLNPAICEMLAAHLTAHPHPETLLALVEKLEREPLASGQSAYPQLLGVFVAAGAQRDPDLVRRAARLVRTAAGGGVFRTLDHVEDLFITRPASLRAPGFLTVLQPMPLDICYAAFSLYDPPPPWPVP